MRPARFQQFALASYQAAGLHAEPWAEGTSRPFGVKIRLPGGAEVWHAVTTQPRDGDRPDEPEEPVEKDAPQPVDVPELPAGRVPVVVVERYLAALLTNAGSAEIARVYGYTDREQRGSVAGFGVEFWSGAKAFAPFVHALRPGQAAPGQGFDLPREV
ncbi:hypothetical protein SAMN06297387_10123 [Streptomyces zhaozhouensis]|uniref:Uncharacterized protein n=1 Tax=Streptomyces zhaozhouensis TaxID=1300267 RepID=A0A286DI06_9ACTN|nr:hypothetical protein [Streptomyces zhaozhouensis]SOD58184.1 hypothetical protein SAMN06297387_10123 [Streptomyces zhaozhouensis]